MEKDIHFKTCKPETQGKLGGDCRLLSLCFSILHHQEEIGKSVFLFRCILVYMFIMKTYQSELMGPKDKD